MQPITQYKEGTEITIINANTGNFVVDIDANGSSIGYIGSATTFRLARQIVTLNPNVGCSITLKANVAQGYWMIQSTAFAQ